MDAAYPCPRDPTRGVRTGSMGRRRRRTCPTPAPHLATRGVAPAMDVSFLNPVLAATGPFATVCADVTHTTENADAELELRVRAIGERLTEQGAPETVVEAGRRRLLEGHEGGEAGPPKGRARRRAPDAAGA